MSEPHSTGFIKMSSVLNKPNLAHDITGLLACKMFLCIFQRGSELGYALQPNSCLILWMLMKLSLA